MCEGNCLHCPVLQRGHDCTEADARAKQRAYVLQQIAEDTCSKHGQFACERCFDMEVPVSPMYMDSVTLERLRKALQL